MHICKFNYTSLFDRFSPIILLDYKYMYKYIVQDLLESGANAMVTIFVYTSTFSWVNKLNLDLLGSR